MRMGAVGRDDGLQLGGAEGRKGRGERGRGRGTRRERKSREEQKINILSSKKQTSRSIELEKEGKEQIG